ncbi:hypothetical protein Syun_023227 [Stephania yunnanensis]|uniref:Uncharacterized protein n=1 Tax=Stephania yunnanensis TaxID=152371 RepID=A0AAP0F9H4_9MAGN
MNDYGLFGSYIVNVMKRDHLKVNSNECYLCVSEGVKWVINMDKYRKIKFCFLQSKVAEPYLEYCGATREEVLRRFVFVEGPGSCYQASIGMG